MVLNLISFWAYPPMAHRADRVGDWNTPSTAFQVVTDSPNGAGVRELAENVLANNLQCLVPRRKSALPDVLNPQGSQTVAGG